MNGEEMPAVRVSEITESGGTVGQNELTDRQALLHLTELVEKLSIEIAQLETRLWNLEQANR